ncbi:MAG: hypothetical protein K2Q18_16100, partial [Bdellovibrionales bacterium]|nr:hypothetical protein [Bdellovibrionales bacterium]
GLPVEIVVLRCPYMNMENPFTRELFSKMMHLKYKGYGNRHLAGTLPLDATDFVADHPLICVRDPKLGLIPITGSKVINYNTCKFFNMDFALETCFTKGENFLHLDALYQIIQEALKNDQTIAYHGGYTIDSEIVKTDEERALVRELFMAITTLYFKENNISELLGFGVPKYKTEHFFYQWGYTRCKVQGVELAEFPVYFLPGANGILMHLKEFSSGINDLSEKFRFIWNQKINVGSIAPKREKALIA